MHDLLRKASRASLSEKNDGAQRNLQDPCTQDVPDNKNSTQDGAPLPNAPPHIPPSNAIPRNILAFRTITTLLSQILQENTFQISHLNSRLQDSNERMELKLSDAFSTIAVIEDEVVALSTKRSPGQKLEIFACIQHSKNKNALTMQPSPSSKLVSQIWHLLVNQDYGGSDPQSPALDPIIGDVLANLDLVDNEALKLHDDEHWSQSTVARHLWIVSKLLTRKDPTVIYYPLTRYIIAACYPKMMCRVNNKTLSQPYIESLKRVKTFKFNESLRDRSSRSHLGDRLFLVNVVSTVGPALDILMPKLTEQAELAMHEKPFQLYTEDTSGEFHSLLVKLLERFQMRLKELANLQGAEEIPTQGSQDFQKCVDSVLACSEALRLLSRTAALKTHLKTIQPLLWYGDHHTDKEYKAIQPFVNTEGMKEEFDDELKAVQPFMTTGGTMKFPWESYLDWLKLMVAHINAAGDLVAYVTGPHFKNQTISMQIIDTPPADQGILPWRELFTDSTLFPIETARELFSFKDDGGITNTGILEFLNKAIESSSEAKTVRKLWDEKDIEGTIASFEKIQDTNFLGWGERAKEQLVKLMQLNGPPDDVLSYEISKAIASLCDSANFFHFLGDARIFTGTMHCEACLASLLDETTTSGESPLVQMEDFGPVIGISERSCCPICQHLFSLLAGRRGQPLIVTGSHNAITPCTLPTWLPAHIVDSMNQFFGDQLRRELVEIINHSELLRNPPTDLDWLTGGLDYVDTSSLLRPDFYL